MQVKIFREYICCNKDLEDEINEWLKSVDDLI